MMSEAMAASEMALRLRPNDAVALLNLGNARLGVGALNDALGAYTRAIESNRGLLEAHNNLGHALRLMGRLDEAVATLSELVRQRPEVADFRVIPHACVGVSDQADPRQPRSFAIRDLLLQRDGGGG